MRLIYLRVLLLLRPIHLRRRLELVSLGCKLVLDLLSVEKWLVHLGIPSSIEWHEFRLLSTQQLVLWLCHEVKLFQPKFYIQDHRSIVQFRLHAKANQKKFSVNWNLTVPQRHCIRLLWRCGQAKSVVNASDLATIWFLAILWIPM